METRSPPLPVHLPSCCGLAPTSWAGVPRPLGRPCSAHMRIRRQSAIGDRIGVCGGTRRLIADGDSTAIHLIDRHVLRCTVISSFTLGTKHEMCVLTKKETCLQFFGPESCSVFGRVTLQPAICILCSALLLPHNNLTLHPGAYISPYNNQAIFLYIKLWSRLRIRIA